MINHHSFILFRIISALVFLSLTIQAQQEGIKPQPPNIIFILTDDHAFQAISSYGSALIHTPGIDRLARKGMCLTNP